MTTRQRVFDATAFFSLAGFLLAGCSSSSDPGAGPTDTSVPTDTADGSTDVATDSKGDTCTFNRDEWCCCGGDVLSDPICTASGLSCPPGTTSFTKAECRTKCTYPPPFDAGPDTTPADAADAADAASDADAAGDADADAHD